MLVGVRGLCGSAHRGTTDLAAETKRAEIIIVATGQPKLITAKHVSPGQTVIDVGINRLDEDLEAKPPSSLGGFASKLVGDVDFVAVEPIVAAISPVPGGVGPLTVASLFANLLDAANLLH